MLWLARSLAKAKGETQPFIGMFLTIIYWFEFLCTMFLIDLLI